MSHAAVYAFPGAPRAALEAARAETCHIAKRAVGARGAHNLRDFPLSCRRVCQPVARALLLLGFTICTSSLCAATGTQIPIASIDQPLVLPASLPDPDALWVPTQFLDEAPPAAGSFFGSRLRMAGDLLVVGVPNADNNSGGLTTNSGRVYIYRLINGHWQLETTLTAPVPQTDAHFGSAVAVSTLTVPIVVVGEPDRDDANGNDGGSVRAYQYLNGVWQNTDVKTDNTPGDRFGAALDVVGDHYVVGVPGRDFQPFQNVGEVDTFARCNNPVPNSWCFAYSHSEAALNSNAGFGNAVAISGDLVIIGASNDSPNAVVAAGSAWIDNLLVNGPLSNPIMLTDPTPGAHELFGASVAASGIFAVGCPGDDEPSGAQNSGAVYVFALNANAPSPEATLRSPAPQSFAQFGAAIALTSNRIAIGEPFREVFFFGGSLPQAGAAHVSRRFFVPGGFVWANVTTVYNFLSDAEYFGTALAIADTTRFAVGAPNRMVAGQSLAGEVAVYQSDLIFADGLE